MKRDLSVRELFDGYAMEFDSIYGAGRRSWWQKRLDRWFRQSMVLRLEKTLEACEPIAGKRVLDAGCGPGHYAVFLARRGAETVVGVDFSTRMIEIAQQHAKEQGVESRCQFVAGDLLAYRSEERFDDIVAMGVMDYIPEPIPFLRHLISLCRGKVMLSFPEAGGILEWQRRLRYRWFSHCELFFYTREDLGRLLEEVAPRRWEIEPIARDFFVIIHVEKSLPV